MKYDLEQASLLYLSKLLSNESYYTEELEDIKYNEYVIVEGYHCSCYGFNDCKWEAMKYSKEELIKLAEVHKDDYYRDSTNDLFEYILNNFKRG